LLDVADDRGRIEAWIISGIPLPRRGVRRICRTVDDGVSTAAWECFLVSDAFGRRQIDAQAIPDTTMAACDHRARARWGRPGSDGAESVRGFSHPDGARRRSARAGRGVSRVVLSGGWRTGG